MVKVCEEEDLREDFVEDARVKMIKLGYKSMIFSSPLKILDGPEKIFYYIKHMHILMENDKIHFCEYKHKYPEEQKHLKLP